MYIESRKSQDTLGTLDRIQEWHEHTRQNTRMTRHEQGEKRCLLFISTAKQLRKKWQIKSDENRH